MTRLTPALQSLRDQHHVDPSLIESLQASAEQSEAHIRVWARMMWTANLSVIAMAALIMGGALAVLRGDGGTLVTIAAFAALLTSAALAPNVLSVLRRQRDTLRLLKSAHRQIWGVSAPTER